MAPSKKLKATEGVVNPTAETASGRRVTRSSTLRSDSPAVPPPPQQKQPPKKKAKTAKGKSSENDEEANVTTVNVNSKVSGSKNILIERCTQCHCFKKGADQVKEGLEKAIPGIIVLINPEKPRRGCFEVREEDGQTFISLQGLKRPFKSLKDLDKEQVVTDIVAKIQS